jgi:hypothetical protein
MCAVLFRSQKCNAKRIFCPRRSLPPNLESTGKHVSLPARSEISVESADT